MTEGELKTRERHDLEWVLSTEQGRRFMWRTLSYCGVFHDIESPSEVAFRQIGRRQVGLFLMDIISTDFPDQYILMQQEQHNRIKEEKVENERANSSTRRQNTDRNERAIDDLIGGYEYSDEYGKTTDVAGLVDTSGGYVPF